MGDVFEAEDELLGRRVAVKLLHEHFARDEAFVSRFRREAQAAANLNHPNIVSIYDWAQEGETYFMVMELIEGRTLRDVLRTEGSLLPRRAAEIIVEASAALAVAHGAGLYHRDDKPGNVMLARDGSVKVTDFGIARAMDDSEELTKTGAVIGTATYFSPEQAQGLPADERSDIYSLGVVLYELLVGSPPFVGDSPVAVAYQHVSEFPTPPSTLNPEVDRTLEAIVLRAMAKRPEDRYQSAEDLRRDLLAYLSGGVAADAVPFAGSDAATELLDAPPPATVPPDETARYVAEEERQPVQPLFVLGVVALVVALIVGIYLLVQLLSGSTTPETIVVPDLFGRTEAEALDLLQDLDLRVRTADQPSADIDAGFVVRTEPPAGTEVEPDSFVTVFVSAGPQKFPVPPLTGSTEEDALTLIADQGLVVGTVTRENSADVELGLVISQNPPAGTEVEPGTAVDLVISDGPGSITMPDLSGLTLAQAQFQLTQLGFEITTGNVDVQQEFSLEVTDGAVVRTEPTVGEELAIEGTVTIFVSIGPSAVPDLVGLTENEARALLASGALELVVAGETVEVTADSGLDGLIAAQDIPAGTEVEPQSEVTVQLGLVPRSIVPPLVGLNEAQAQATLAGVALQLAVGGTTEVELSQVGTVLTQDPSAETEVFQGSTVTVTIGVARQARVPNITGLTEAEARAVVEGDFLQFVVGDPTPGSEGFVGKVVSVEPAEGTSVPEGTIVTVSLGSPEPTTTTTSTTTTSSTTTTTSP